MKTPILNPTTKELAALYNMILASRVSTKFHKEDIEDINSLLVKVKAAMNGYEPQGEKLEFSTPLGAVCNHLDRREKERQRKADSHHEKLVSDYVELNNRNLQLCAENQKAVEIIQKWINFFTTSENPDMEQLVLRSRDFINDKLF